MIGNADVVPQASITTTKDTKSAKDSDLKLRDLRELRGLQS